MKRSPRPPQRSPGLLCPELERIAGHLNPMERLEMAQCLEGGSAQLRDSSLGHAEALAGRLPTLASEEM